jgi:thiol-disulfide isomerase/thioredoxin
MREMKHGTRTERIAAILCVAFFIAGAGLVPLRAQSPEAVRQTGFSLVEDYYLEIDGSRSESASIYSSQLSRAILVVSEDLSVPVLLWPRTRVVELIHLLKMSKSDDGLVELLPDPVLTVEEPFRVEGAEVKFMVAGSAASLKPRPPLLGLHELDGMLAHSAAYAQRARAYEPSPQTVEGLRREQRDVRVLVFFGSWCPACGQAVPRIMKLAEELGESRIRVEFYGLPRGIAGDPEAERFDIHSVPSAVIFVDGEEKGRINGNEWRSPEQTLSSLLGLS